MIPKHINNYSDLQTSRGDICAGFLFQALTKTKKAEPYTKRAKEFYEAIKKINTIDELLSLENFREELISASGFSEKAKKHLTNAELIGALTDILKKIVRESNHEFREEIIYRYLLTKGDSLGGSMRNLTGAMAGSKMASMVEQELRVRNLNPDVVKGRANKIQRISWKDRCLCFDVKPKIVDKNIDMILLDCADAALFSRDLLETYPRYIACGELKGGIDPAGADEHWKTGNTSLGRIEKAFSVKKLPYLFFVGAAIEAAMAKEIFAELENGHLAHAANLHYQNQLDDLVDWLISL